MIDVHTHILPFIDDGSDCINESFKMIEKEISIGIKNIVLTPHALRKNIKTYTKQELIDAFYRFKEAIKDKYDVNLYLGQEISYHPDLLTELKKNQLLTINNTDFILLELPFRNEIEDIDEIIYSCNVLGYKVVIAHVERYEYLNLKKILHLKNLGVLIQVNSNSITGVNDKAIQSLVNKLFKHNLVDFVASDVHSFRSNNMLEAYKLVNKKFGEEVSRRVFNDNAKELFNII